MRISKITFTPLKRFSIICTEGLKIPVKDASLVEHDVYKTIVVHPRRTTLEEEFHYQACDWVATERRTGFAIAVGKTKIQAAKAAIKKCDAHGIDEVEAAVKWQLKRVRDNKLMKPWERDDK